MPDEIISIKNFIVLNPVEHETVMREIFESKNTYDHEEQFHANAGYARADCAGAAGAGVRPCLCRPIRNYLFILAISDTNNTHARSRRRACFCQIGIDHCSEFRRCIPNGRYAGGDQVPAQIGVAEGVCDFAGDVVGSIFISKKNRSDVGALD